MTDAPLTAPPAGPPLPAAAPRRDPRDAYNFAGFLQHVEDGELHMQLSEALTNVVAKLHDHFRDHGGKPRGKIAIDLNLKLDSGTIEVEADFKATTPKSARPRTIFWARPDNTLTKSNPRQPDMFPRDVSHGSGAPRTV